MKNRRFLPLSSRLMTLAALPVLITVIVLTVAAASVALRTTQSMLEDQLTTVAFMLSRDANVENALEDGAMPADMSTYLDSVLADNNSIDVISIADMNGIRVYHNNKALIGERFVGGDDERVYLGQSYTSVAKGTLGQQLRAFRPVYGSDGTQTGFVMVSCLISRVQAMETRTVRTLIILALILLVPCVVTAVLSADRIKKTLMGYEPEQIAQVLAEREDVFESLEEGLIAADVEGNILLANAAARRFLGDESLTGQKAKKLLPEAPLEQTLQTGEDSQPVDIVINGYTLLCECLPLRSGEKCIGAVAVLRDETGLRQMAEELTGVNHFVESLRANQHEFMNKLHVILGLLQAGDADAAKEYITRLGDQENGISQTILRRIQNRTVAAMLLGKITHGRELGIEITVAPNSSLPTHSAFLPTDALVTVLGNIIENSIEAIDADRRTAAEEDEEIFVMVHEDDQALMITVDDTGPGIRSDMVGRIFTRGFTTKGTGHGNGLAAVQRIVKNAGGDIDVDSREGEGTSITVTIGNRREKR